MRNFLFSLGLFLTSISWVYSQGFEVLNGASPMNVTRYNHAAVSLPDGKVLAVGGHTQDFLITSTAEIFDPLTGTWTLYNIDNPHDACSFVELSDGRFMFFGGFSGGSGVGQSNVTTIFNPTTNTFTNGPTMNVARALSTAIKLADNRILIVGNWYNTGDAEIYDPATNTFTSVGTPIVERAYPVVFPCNDGGAAILGGFGVYGSPFYSDIVYFNPTTSQFSSLSPEIIEGETGWLTYWNSFHPLVSKMKLSNGNYIFMIYRAINSTDYEFSFAEFNPETKVVNKLNSTPAIPLYTGLSPNEWAYGLNLMKDPSDDIIYFVGVVPNSSPISTRLYAYKYQSNTLEIPSGEIGLSHYLYSSSKAWVGGNLLCTGGTIDGSNFNITNDVKLIRPVNSLNVTDLSNTPEIQIYPNPVLDNHFEINCSGLSVQTIEIHDLSGKIVKQVQVNSNNPKHMIETQNIAPGLYIIKITGVFGVYTQPLVIL
jgi:hypothetical protein